ncbi:hypothetical protein CHRYSEOSP005_00170 [Chryseobacterium sp. Alg-005]|uniref:hypothetical protein n=1 Tax=Chryseobacterium sp. Alg-005 TaxID=3159516 RepID=UPI0035559AB7
MTFEELKFEILDRQRKKEISKLFHLYVKAETYRDILAIVKSEGNFRWILKNGFRDLIQYFPVEDLEIEGFYDREVELSDMSTDIIILSNGILNLSQTGNKRCRVICDGGRLNITQNDFSMVEIECYERSLVYMTANSYSYGYITTRDQSSVSITGNDNTTFVLYGFGNSYSSAELQPNSYVNYKLEDQARFNFII